MRENFPAVMESTFNRTSLEWKRSNLSCCDMVNILLIAPVWNGNQPLPWTDPARRGAFNRTRLEWKLVSAKCFDEPFPNLLIAPVWNGNVTFTARNGSGNVPFNRTRLEWKRVLVCAVRPRVFIF